MSILPIGTDLQLAYLSQCHCPDFLGNTPRGKSRSCRCAFSTAGHCGIILCSFVFDIRATTLFSCIIPHSDWCSNQNKNNHSKKISADLCKYFDLAWIFSPVRKKKQEESREIQSPGLSLLFPLAYYSILCMRSVNKQAARRIIPPPHIHSG